MKPVEEWTEKDINDMIVSQVEEHLGLDYKGAGALAKTDKSRFDLSKDVSVFANSAGGLLIYGVTERDHFPEAIDPVDPGVITKEWLEQVINSRIQRRIDGIRIFPVQLSGKAAGKVVYLIWVPASPDAPHQASDKLYYKRFNFLSTAMEDYELRDISNRRRHPRVVATLSMDSMDSRAQIVQGQLQVTLSNEGRSLAEKVYLELCIPVAARGEVNSFTGESGKSTIDGVAYHIYKYFHRDNGGPLPIFPGTKKNVFDGSKQYLALKVPGELYRHTPSPPIICTVFADGGEPQAATVTLKDFMDAQLAKFKLTAPTEH